MRLSLLTLSVALFACGPTPVVPDAGSPLGCRDTAKTPANLIENGAFECDTSPPEWSAVYGTFETVSTGRSGRAGQITVNPAGGRFAYSKDFAVDAGNKTFCFSAYLKGTAPFMRMRVLRVMSGSVQEVAFSEQVFSDFRKIPTLKVTNDNAPKLQLVFEAQTNRSDGMNAMPGQTLLIDDVDVWESAANCSETR
ncbi:MAG: hypothetical protein Q8N23_08715 [Archangium sp.]|nr:hypothetical protein [Archangium sp.]MDP3152738.1 hypothetical protein [Archangium sp.]MDP3573525.1 hypothetical protein [Archangium sp.]